MGMREAVLLGLLILSVAALLSGCHRGWGASRYGGCDGQYAPPAVQAPQPGAPAPAGDVEMQNDTRGYGRPKN